MVKTQYIILSQAHYREREITKSKVIFRTVKVATCELHDD
ncbi:uncharacterized protein G2W53_002661 [Senna tora]|uniref:Uncharacterized protein n=1 Tax=Senna tora TaxID=362788 RepID=A0A834X9N0_9FABA|nr:uncharacterized protein G2W53_002661 [Senna tora]